MYFLPLANDKSSYTTLQKESQCLIVYVPAHYFWKNCNYFTSKTD